MEADAFLTEFMSLRGHATAITNSTLIYPGGTAFKEKGFWLITSYARVYIHIYITQSCRLDAPTRNLVPDVGGARSGRSR